MIGKEILAFRSHRGSRSVEKIVQFAVFFRCTLSLHTKSEGQCNVAAVSFLCLLHFSVIGLR